MAKSSEKRKVYNKTYKLQHRSQIRAAQERYKLKRTYGITLEDKSRMVQSQNNRCMICHSSFKNSRDTHLDHDHITGRLRDVLCGTCNVLLGFAKDSPELLENAVNYLRKWRK